MDKSSVEKGESLKRINFRRRKQIVFFTTLVVLPLLQFAIFYIYVNINSFILSFQEYSWKEGVLGLNVTFAGFENFSVAFDILLSGGKMIVNSMQMFLLSTVLGLTLALLFSYYIYKKLPFSGGFRVLLFMPSIISGIVMVAMYKYFVGSAVPYISETIFGKEMKLGLLASRQESNVKFTTIMFFLVWSGFGGGVLMYSNAMSGVSQEVVDSAHLDGAMGLREFWYITVPGIWPTLSTFLITGVAGIFTNQAGLYSFFGDTADIDLQTYGYRIYVNTLRAQTTGYPELSAFGLYMTAVALPVTYLVKYLLERFGPSED
jgi:ABC-type sugar transport system permease subunit